MAAPSTRNLVVLGSTGSIGVQTLDLVRRLREAHPVTPPLRVVGIAAHRNVELLAQQILEFRPDVAVLRDAAAALRLRESLPPHCATHVLGGDEGLIEAATWASADVVLGAMLGSAGLAPTLAAIRARKTIALANKETLVAAGEIVMRAARAHDVRLLPVDSEHSAIYQCLVGEPAGGIRRLMLTASGGPFVDLSPAELQRVTRAQALAHPTWRMGSKITIDSATLMNKGLEIIEAHWLFGVDIGSIDVVVHRQSLIHSLVEFVDGSVKAQLGIPDMRLPIQYALLYPERIVGPAPPLNLVETARLTFEPPDPSRFSCLRLAREAGAAGGTCPAVLNAANEVAVEAFLQDRLNFIGIPRTIERTLERHDRKSAEELETILNADHWARATAHELIDGSGAG